MRTSAMLSYASPSTTTASFPFVPFCCGTWSSGSYDSVLWREVPRSRPDHLPRRRPGKCSGPLLSYAEQTAHASRSSTPTVSLPPTVYDIHGTDKVTHGSHSQPAVARERPLFRALPPQRRQRPSLIVATMSWPKLGSKSTWQKLGPPRSLTEMTMQSPRISRKTE